MPRESIGTIAVILRRLEVPRVVFRLVPSSALCISDQRTLIGGYTLRVDWCHQRTALITGSAQTRLQHPLTSTLGVTAVRAYP